MCIFITIRVVIQNYHVYAIYIPTKLLSSLIVDGLIPRDDLKLLSP